MRPAPIVSFIIATFNRADVLVRTLVEIERCGLEAGEYEVLIVDNARDETLGSRIAPQFPATERASGIRVITPEQNLGACARNLALPVSRGRYIVFLDDDSFPAPGSIARMIRHFQSLPKLGAAMFNITLPDGSSECSAYPDVFIGCGVGFRRRALAEVGGLPDDYFMAAEEYDLSLRLLDAGWELRRFDDLQVMHLKTPSARFSGRIMRLDVRNNLTLIARRFPERWKIPFAIDWTRRYWAIARARGLRLAFVVGLLQGMCRWVLAVEGEAISEEAFERFARIEEIRHEMGQRMRPKITVAEEPSPLPSPGLPGEGKREDGRAVVLVDYGKNIRAYWLAAKALGLRVAAIADNRLAGSMYRGIPVVTDAEALALPFDAAIISNSSPLHAQSRRHRWRLMQSRPVIDPLEITGGAAEHPARRTAARSA